MLQAPPAGPLQPEDWRLKCLLDEGVPLFVAEQIAYRKDVDLHDALALAQQIKNKGQPLTLVAEILL